MKSQFRRLLKLKDRLSVRFDRMRDEINAKYEATLREAYKAKFPRRKWIIAKSLTDNTDEHNAIFDKWESTAIRISKNYYKARDEIETKLKEMAPYAGLFPYDMWTKYYVSDSYTYSSQGFGAITYAKRAAEMRMTDASMNGLECHLSVINREYTRGYGRSAQFTVWVNTDHVGVEILKRMPTDLVEWVCQCWAKGVNPRVYCPLLPHGFEEKHGLDYFGNKK